MDTLFLGTHLPGGLVLFDTQRQSEGPNVVLFQVLDNDGLSGCRFCTELPELPLLVHPENTVEVLRNLIRLESVEVEDVVIQVPVDTDDCNRGIVSLGRSRVREVDSCEDVQTTVLVMEVTVTHLHEVDVEVLETLRVDWRIIDRVRVVVVLRTELSPIKVLSTLPSKNFLIEAKPLTIFPLLAR